MEIGEDVQMAGTSEGPRAEAVEKTELSVEWPMAAGTSCTSSGGWAKREEGLASSRQQQQACATPELLDKLREEVALLPPLQVEDGASPKPEGTSAPTSANPPKTAAAVQEGDGPSNTAQQPDSKTEPAVPQTVHFLRGTNTTSSTKSNLRRGRPNSLRSGLPSPRPMRHGPGTRRHSSTGSRPRPPVGKENLKSSLRFTSQGDCVFNAPAMAHLAAVKARREEFISQLVSTGPTGPEHGCSQPRRGASIEVPHSRLESVVEAPLTPSGEDPKEGQDVPPSEEMGDEVEPMDVDESPGSMDAAQKSSPSRTPVTASPAAAEALALHEETTMAAPTKVPGRPAAPAPCNDDFFFVLPDIPPEPSPSTKRESIIQIRERNAGMVRSSVEVFNRAAAAVHESPVVTRSRRTAVARKTSGTSRPPLRETNFRRPGSPTRQNRRDWEMEL
ncbi:collagen alpha-1(XXVII) chain [Rhipicephalus sanguineus]|uniref:collagen alpha-1(XXVII) chain n=1 Tax=Rhipicephalus sanguineus TaxID=34632 RepID=UPI0020C1D97A|nr:collagen alpha-1(XXVII) chain [Rhipicephalus sanguineus]